MLLLLGLAACGADPETSEEAGGPASASGEAPGLVTLNAASDTSGGAGEPAAGASGEASTAGGEGGGADLWADGAACDDNAQCKSGSCVDGACGKDGDIIVIGTIVIE